MHRPAPPAVLLLTHPISDEELALLFDLGLADAFNASPEQSTSFIARLRRLLRSTPWADASHRRGFLQRLETCCLSSDNPYQIGAEAIRLVAETLHAQWGMALLIDEEDSDHETAEVMAVYRPPQGPCQHAGVRCPRHLLPTASQNYQWVFGPPAKLLPVSPLHEVLQTAHLQWVGVYRVPISENLHSMLLLGWPRPPRLASQDLTLIAPLTRWLSAMIYRALQLRSERFASQQARILTDLILTLNRGLDVDTVLERLLDGLQKVVPYQQASVWLWQEDGRLAVEHIRGFPFSKEKFQECIAQHDTPPSTWQTTVIINETKRPLLIADTHAFPDWERTAQGKHIRSWLGVPLIYDEKVMGILALDADKPNHFTMTHVKMAQTLANAAAIALQNARLYQQERRQRRELEALRVASLQLVSHLDLSAVLTSLLQQAVALANADQAHIFLYDGQRLDFGAAIWDGQIRSKPHTIPRPHGLTYTVARSGQPKLVPRIQDDPLFAETSWEGTILSIPLVARRQVRGVMNVGWDQEHRVSDTEMTLLSMLADHAAIALENAHLVSALQRTIQRLTLLSEASAALRTASDATALTRELGQWARRLAEGQYVLVAHFTETQASTPRLVLDYVEGFPDDSVQQHFPQETRIIQHALNGQHLTVFDDIHRLAVENLTWARQLGPTILAALRTRQGKTIGLLLVGRSAEAKAFSNEAVSSIQVLAEMGAASLRRLQARQQLEEAFMQAVLALSHTIDVHDAYHGDHSKTLAEWAVVVAQEMGLPADEIETVRLGALLHDIGKIGVPDKILRKPGPLTSEEWEIMRRHPSIGAQILRPLERLQKVAEIVEAHHERWDGKGYPRGLKGEEIPLGARILAVVDSYAAMTDQRVYHEARPPEEAVAEIRREAGKRYDPRVVEAFLKVAGRLKPSPYSLAGQTSAGANAEVTLPDLPPNLTDRAPDIDDASTS